MRANVGANVGLCVAIALLGTGCTGVPALPIVGQDTKLIAGVVDRVQCEVREAIVELGSITDDRGARPFAWVTNYVAKAVLTLQMNTDGGATPEVSLLGPFQSGTYSVGFQAGVLGGANRIATYGFNLGFARSEPSWCKDIGNKAYPPLQGDLGLREWFVTVLQSHNANNPFPRPKSLSHRIEFTLDGSLRLTPAYVLRRSRGSGIFSLHAKSFHILDIAIEYVDPEAPDYTKVCVVNLARPCPVPPKVAPPPIIGVTAEVKGEPKRGMGKKAAAPRAVEQRGRPRPKPISPDVEQRLDRALQNLEIRSIAPRF